MPLSTVTSDKDALAQCNQLRGQITAALRIQASARRRFAFGARSSSARRALFASAPDITSLDGLMVGTRAQVLATLTIQEAARPYLARLCGRRLLWSVENGGVADVQRLLAAKADLESTCGSNSETPLAVASKIGRRAVAALLLEAGANLESADEDAFTPLMWAAFHGHEDVVRLLCEADANTETRDEQGNTPLIVATLAGHEGAMRILCEAGAETTARNKYGMAALAVARTQRKPAPLIAILNDRGADDAGPETPPPVVDHTPGEDELFWAAAKGDVLQARRLLAAKADVEFQHTSSGMTPLLVACHNKGEDQVSVARLLLEAGANTEARRKDGSTALILSVQEDKDLCNVSLSRMLLEFGANPDAARKDGKRALDLAEELRAEWWTRAASARTAKQVAMFSSVDTTILKRLLVENIAPIRQI